MKHHAIRSPLSTTTCPFCHSQGGFSNTRVSIAEGTIYTCDCCSGYFLFPPVRVAYDNSDWTKARALNWVNDVQLAHDRAPRICKEIESYLDRPVRNILEIGCGSGFMGMGFISAGCDYKGIDRDPKAIEFARNKGIDAYHLCAEEILSSTLSTQKYDLIISSNVFEHIDAPLRALQNLESVCGGALVLIVPNPEGLFQRLRARTSIRRFMQSALGEGREIAYSIDGYWHNIAYTRQTLKYLCERTGLEPLKIAPMSINDPSFGFVQRNKSALYRLASGFAGLLGMGSEILLIAKVK